MNKVDVLNRVQSPAGENAVLTTFILFMTTVQILTVESRFNIGLE